MTHTQQQLTLSLTLVALLASSVVALAQGAKTPATKSPTPAALQLDEPTNGNNSLAAPPASIDMPSIPDLERAANQTNDQNIIVTASEATRLRELEQKVARLEQLIEGQSATLQDIADKVSAPSAELKAIRDELVKLNSKQTVARADLSGEAPSLAGMGKMVVDNHTAATYTPSVNGFQVVVPPGRSEVSNLPVGAITTELIGYETPKTWAAGDWRDVGGAQQLAIRIR
jgi:uncharacterized coiled-coil protein SlyX